MKNETSGEAAYSPKIGELVTIRDEVDKTDKDSPLHITFRYVAAGMREGYRQARAGYTPPEGRYICTCGKAFNEPEGRTLCYSSHTPPAAESQVAKYEELISRLRKILVVKMPWMHTDEYLEWARCLSKIIDEHLAEVPKPQPPASDAEELAETCDRLDLAHENEKLREVLEKIAATDTSPSFPDFLWLQRWRNETKDAASKALKGEK